MAKIPVLACCALVAAPAFAFDKPTFPRLAASELADVNYQKPEIQQMLARNNIVVIQYGPDWNLAGQSPQQALSGIKAINPNVLIFNYIKIDSINTQSNSEPYQKLQAQNWFAYPNGGGGNPTVASSGNGAAVMINTTLFAPTDSNGDRWVDWFAKYAVRTMGVPALDGFLTDNVFTGPNVDADWNRDGTTDSRGNPTVQSWYRQGFRHHFDVLNQQMPGKFQIGNRAFDPRVSEPEYEGALNGGVMEGMMGYSWSWEAWAGWQGMMDLYRNSIAKFAEPKLAIFAVAGDPNDYRTMRYALTSCLMDDGYFQFNASYNGQDAANNDDPWFDEYGARLGYATSSPTTSAWQSGVYRRDFQNGIALVNPKGNGARQVFLDDDYVKLSGTQDSNTNNGQTVRSVILQERDGIILMRRNASNGTPVTAPVTPTSSSSSSSVSSVASSSSSSSSVSSSSSSSRSSSSSSSISSAAAPTPTATRVPAPPTAVNVK